MTARVAQSPELNSQSAHEASKTEDAPQEQPVSNGKAPSAGKLGAGRDCI